MNPSIQSEAASPLTVHPLLARQKLQL
jgi:hypothetical protein